ncbi:MAG: FAD-binding oxidoreductase [Acidimicrobiia bacterium]|nr:MAG: FAD-binding oxidoreductase [Acidimicrobiia bacterium]
MKTLAAPTTRLLRRLHDPTVDIDAEFVVAPTSMEEAAEILAAATEVGQAVAFYGAGTHRQIGSPVDADLVITTTAMNRIVDYQPDDLTVVAEPGVTLADLEAALADRNLTAVLPETEPNATVGGVVATGRSGYQRLRYGPTRDRVLRATMATGYGKVVTGGSPVVKASTGYGMPRLFTGSFGTLGLIGPVLLKLWSQPRATATVVVDEPEVVRNAAYRPLAVLGTGGIGRIYLGGTREEVDAQAEAIGGRRSEGLDWPESHNPALRLSFRVPARFVDDAVAAARDLDTTGWVAQYGVGIVEAGYDRIAPGGFAAARSWAESVGGSLVIEASPDELRRKLGAWGSPPDSAALQRQVKVRFDPAGICNPGILPGGI